MTALLVALWREFVAWLLRRRWARMVSTLEQERTR